MPEVTTSNGDLATAISFGTESSLAAEDLTGLALGEAHFRLLQLVKVVVARVERIVEVLHVTCRVQDVPGLCAFLCFASLQDQEKGVQA